MGGRPRCVGAARVGACVLALVAACGARTGPGDDLAVEAGTVPSILDASSIPEVSSPPPIRDAGPDEPDASPCDVIIEGMEHAAALQQDSGNGDGFYVDEQLTDLVILMRNVAFGGGFVDTLHGVDCSVAYDACTYDPFTPQLDASDIHYSNPLRQFVGPDGQSWVWAYVSQQNVYVLASASRAPATYQLVLEYNECTLGISVVDASVD
jgi:hypothetical protein